MASPAARLRALLAEPGCHPRPCCFDALSARRVERAGFPEYDAGRRRYANEP